MPYGCLAVRAGSQQACQVPVPAARAAAASMHAFLPARREHARANGVVGAPCDAIIISTTQWGPAAAGSHCGSLAAPSPLRASHPRAPPACGPPAAGLRCGCCTACGARGLHRAPAPVRVGGRGQGLGLRGRRLAAQKWAAAGGLRCWGVAAAGKHCMHFRGAEAWRCLGRRRLVRWAGERVKACHADSSGGMQTAPPPPLKPPPPSANATPQVAVSAANQSAHHLGVHVDRLFELPLHGQVVGCQPQLCRQAAWGWPHPQRRGLGIITSSATMAAAARDSMHMALGQPPCNPGPHGCARCKQRPHTAPV